MPAVQLESALRGMELSVLLARHYPEASPENIAKIVRRMQLGARRSLRLQRDLAAGKLSDSYRISTEHKIRLSATRINNLLSIVTLSNLGNRWAMVGAHRGRIVYFFSEVAEFGGFLLFPDIEAPHPIF